MRFPRMYLQPAQLEPVPMSHARHNRPYICGMFREYQPCLPTRATKAPSGERWLFEPKLDGFRIIARRMNGVVRLQTKQGYDYSKRYPRIVEALLRLKVSSVVLDGEAACFTGMADDFDKLWNRTHDHEAKLCAFDLVCKRVDLPYRAGPSKSWLKIKNKAHPALLRVKEAFELERQRRS